MKIKTIASIFNRNRRLEIYTAPNGEQWIGNGYAAYSLRGMPRMTPEIILRIFDVPLDKHNKWLCGESELPTAICFTDYDENEADIEPSKIDLCYSGDTFRLFPDGRRIYSFNEDYIKPLLDESDYLTYHKRETASGGFVLACKVGMELKAIITPAALHKSEKFTDEIAKIAYLYAAMAQLETVNAAYEIYRTQDADTPPEVDEETGEVLDDQIYMNVTDTEGN